MGIKHWTIFSMLVSGFFCFPQNDYVQKFPEKFTVRLGLSNTNNSFTSTNNEGESLLEVVPNDKTSLGVSFLFRSLELYLGFAPNFFSENKDNNDSKLFSLNFRMFLGQWMQTLDFYDQKGFFVSDGIDTIEFPEFTTLKVGGTTSYIFNRNFSFRAIGFQNEWQKKSAGSFIPRLSYYYTKFDERINTSQSVAHSFDIALGPGYYYNFVIGRNVILSPGATVGFGINRTKFDGVTETTALTQIIFRTAIGYNSERFFAGLNANAQLLHYRTDPDTFLDDTIAFVEIYMGYRFDAPKGWVDKADKFNRKFGFD